MITEEQIKKDVEEILPNFVWYEVLMSDDLLQFRLLTEFGKYWFTSYFPYDGSLEGYRFWMEDIDYKTKDFLFSGMDPETLAIRMWLEGLSDYTIREVRLTNQHTKYVSIFANDMDPLPLVCNEGIRTISIPLNFYRFRDRNLYIGASVESKRIVFARVEELEKKGVEVIDGDGSGS